MKQLTRILGVAFVHLLLVNQTVLSGQNSGAGIRFDFNATTSGNQNLTNIACPGANNFVRVDIYVTGASNLDTYEFNIIYDTSQLQFMGGAEDNPVTFETNFLKTKGGSTTGFTCTASGGVVNCANTLVGDNPAQAPEGEGLLASIVFKALVDCPGKLSFGDVYWYDINREKDVCTDKGADASLPVQLSLFEAEAGDKQVLLEWTTESEVNLLGFNVQRASQSDSSNFIKINNKMIKAAGNSTSRSAYSYMDRSVQNNATYFYRLESVEFNGARSYSKIIAATPQEALYKGIPQKYGLSQNYPNPFNPETTIEYQLPEATHVEIKLYNLLGEEVMQLVDEDKQAGYYSVTLSGLDEKGALMGSGVYILRLVAGDFIQYRKLILLR